MAPIDRSFDCGYLDFAFTVRRASQVKCRSKSKTTRRSFINPHPKDYLYNVRRAAISGPSCNHLVVSNLLASQESWPHYCIDNVIPLRLREASNPICRPRKCRITPLEFCNVVTFPPPATPPLAETAV